ncbi:MAG: helix-turn-helix transcriptional regulator [Ilumatobacteraceae bacterium]
MVTASLAVSRSPSRPLVGELLRDWRNRRRRSQLDLAVDVGMSTRHLSFVETGRSRPSPELLLTIAEHLDVPLRERNDLLLAAGYAPRFSERALDDPALRTVRASLQRMLDAHDPYPGVVIDRVWNIVAANAAAGALVAGLPAAVLGPPLNVYRVCLHPEGLAARTVNFDDWARYLLGQLRRSITVTADAGLRELYDEVSAYPNVAAVATRQPHQLGDDPPLLVPVTLLVDELGTELSLFTTLTTFGTPRDITLDELAVELFFPADDAADALLRGTATAR